MYAKRPRVAEPFRGSTGLLSEVGDTPLISLTDAVRRLVPEIPAGVQVLAKCEWFNPGGSVKDRPALSMVLAAERSGALRPGMTLLDASSGNTGIAYAMVAAARGYQLALCLPKNANAERRQLLAAYGARIIDTDPLEGSDGAIRAARALSASDPDLVYLDQYSNPANWQAHFQSTGPEILGQSQGSISHFVAVVGTGGTFTGVGRFLRRAKPEIQLVEVQPDSPFHGLEGMKFMETSIVPPIWDSQLADRRIGAPTEESLAWVRHLASEGVLIGPSGGAALWAAVEVAKGLEGGTVVTVLPDSGTRYLSEPHIWSAP